MERTSGGGTVACGGALAQMYEAEGVHWNSETVWGGLSQGAHAHTHKHYCIWFRRAWHRGICIWRRLCTLRRAGRSIYGCLSAPSPFFFSHHASHLRASGCGHVRQAIIVFHSLTQCTLTHQQPPRRSGRTLGKYTIYTPSHCLCGGPKPHFCGRRWWMPKLDRRSVS